MSLAFAEQIGAEKHRLPGESHEEACARRASALKDNDAHFKAFKDILVDRRFLEGGRVQSAVGAPKRVTPFNCFVSSTIPDSMKGIMKALDEAAETMRMGGGIGYDFSTLRPRGDMIRTLDSKSCGPVGFMRIFDALCQTIASSGHRRGAQMAVMRVDHPDIEDFIRAKRNSTALTGFNISVGVTDEFMVAVENGAEFPLSYMGKVYKHVDARSLWEEIMRSTWEWAEPGVLFIDTINRMNNLHYCETIAATNPCGEQPLPPYGACLLGSFNLTRYVYYSTERQDWCFNTAKLGLDIPVVVRAMDNVIDQAIYPLAEQEAEAKNKRRMGLGVTGVANAAEIMGMPYGSEEMLHWLYAVLELIANESYLASAKLAKEKGPFPAFDRDRYMQSKFVQGLWPITQERIAECGIRNSHLTSIAPTGTISISAGNVSSGIEPVWAHSFERVVQTFDGPITEHVTDYAYRTLGVEGKLAVECTAQEHLDVLLVASRWMDSAVSKTCNVSPDMPWEDFNRLYYDAWKGGAKGITTFNPGGKRFGILQDAKPDHQEDPEDVAEACYIDPETGQKECS